MVRSLVAFSLLISMLISMHPAASPYYGLALPKDGLIVVPFGPIGRYAGHWGVDIAVDAGSDVRSIGAGTVTFAGPVAGRRSVTVDHGGGIRTSYSYLGTISVAAGQAISGAGAVGTADIHNGRVAFHLSLRIGSTYRDPLVLAACSQVPEPALWLAEPTFGYPAVRDRNSRGHVRPSTRRSSGNGPSNSRAAWSR